MKKINTLLIVCLGALFIVLNNKKPIKVTQPVIKKIVRKEVKLKDWSATKNKRKLAYYEQLYRH